MVLLPTINHSCNFIIYVMSNKAFRDEFLSMVKGKQRGATNGGEMLRIRQQIKQTNEEIKKY